MAGLAAPADGALDEACADAATLADAASCSLTCTAGFYIAGDQPSCTAGAFDGGTISCTACEQQAGCETHTAGSCTGQQLDCEAASPGYTLVGTVATACTAQAAGCTTPDTTCVAGTDKLGCAALDAGYTTDATTGLVREIQCNVPSTAPAGYDVSGMACSATGPLTTTCETPATCATGFSGDVTVSCTDDATDLVLTGCVEDLVCVLPRDPVAGYDFTGMACSAMTSTGVTCETPATCATGYSGEIAYSCDSAGAQLSVSGCADTDECGGVDCGLSATCTPSAAPGTDYTCSCGDGLTGDSTVNAPTSCTDTDGCIDGNGAAVQCGANAACVDQSAPNDGYSCACVAGFNGPTTAGEATSCAPNPTCDALSSSLCACQRDSEQATNPASNSCRDATTVDLVDLSAVCATDTCAVADCCVDFQPCPANSQVIGFPGAGHGQPCVCNPGYSGSITWDTATENYSGTCEPIACPDHPLFPAATGGKRADGTGSTNCECPAGYSVKPHCQDTTQDTCDVALDGLATDDDGCLAASSAPVTCVYTAPVGASEPRCSVAAGCADAPPGQAGCDAVVNAAGQAGDCDFTAGNPSSCAPTATCPTTEVEADCVATEATCADGVSVTQTDCVNAGSTWAAPCAFTAPTCSVTAPSCTGDADEIPATCGEGFDSTFARCAVNAAGDGCDLEDGDCTFVAAYSPTCDLDAGTDNSDACPAGCDATPAAITSDADCTAAGGSWLSGSCSAVAEASCAVSIKQNDETSCIGTVSSGMSGVCSFTATVVESCSVKASVVTACGPTFSDAIALGGAPEASCETNSCVYTLPLEPVAEACELALDRTTKDLCELTPSGDLTGLIWDGGVCYRQLPSLTTDETCTMTASGGVYSPAQSAAAASCVSESGNIVTVADQVACEGTATGYTWVPGACSDTDRDVNTCLVTGNTWRARAAGSCVTSVGTPVTPAAASETECLFESDGTTPTAYIWRAEILDACITPAATEPVCTGAWSTDASDRTVTNGVVSDTGTPFAGCVVVAADQAECESLASINTWTDDTCMDNRPLPAESVDGYSDRESCEGTTNNVWTPAVLATPHSCANNGLWNSATDDQVACEMTASGNIWTTSTTIDFDSSTNTYSGICTPKICPSVTIASGSVSASSQFFYTGNGVDIVCNAGYEPVGDVIPAVTPDACTTAGHTWKESKCSAWSAGQCNSWTTAVCVVTHLTCQADATYDFNVPTCVAKQCGSVTVSRGSVSANSPPDNGFTFSPTNSGGLSVVCEEGYEVVTEQKTGSCSIPSITTKTACEATVASCSDALLTTAEDCVSPAVWTAAGVWTISAASTTRGYGTCSDASLTTKAACVAPAVWDEKTEQFDCPESGTWAGGVPLCKPRRCPTYCGTAECSDEQNDLDPGPEPRLRNGVITGTRSYRPGTTDPDWTFTCNRGYELIGATEATCQVNGEWTVPPPECVLITWCELPADFERDVFEVDGQPLGTRILNIDDCWLPDQRLYGRNSKSGIDVMDPSDPAKTDTCEVRCFPTCDPDTGKDAEGKPCEASSFLDFASATFKCDDGGEWIGTKPNCQRAPVSQSGALLPSPLVMVQLLLALLPAAVLRL